MAVSKRYFALISVLLLIAGSGIAGEAPAQSPPPDPARGGPAAARDTVVIGTSSEPAEGVHPLFFTSFTSANVISAIFTTDVEVNPRKNGQPFAQGVEFLPNVRDGTWKLDGERMTLLWKIKPRTWHDGRPVTCGDYVFTYRVLRDERVPGSGRGSVRLIANVVCPKGEYGVEVAVNWKSRYPLADQGIFGQFFFWVVLPRHVLEPFYRLNPSRFDQTPYGYDPRATIGDGAYRWVEWRKGESLTLEAVSHHPIFGTPKIRRIIWRFIRDPNALAEQLLSGAIDAIHEGVITLDQAVELERRAAGRVKVFFEPAPRWEHLDFNFDNPLLQDMRVRRAIAHGVNRTQIVQQVFYGKPRVSHAYLPPSNPGYTDDLQKYPYDPARARALLREAGFWPGPDGIMQHASGQRLSLELTTTSGNRPREQVQQIIQQQLRQVGIEITILNFPDRIFFGEIMRRRKFKALAMYTLFWGPREGCSGTYTSDAVPAEHNAWAGGNYPGYKSADMDRVCKAISLEVDADGRKQILQESARIFARDLPALPLYYAATTLAAKVGLENFGPRVPTTATWNAHTWHWR